MEEVLVTTDLTKKFGKREVVNRVNLHVNKGDIYGFIGRNGAGKTTTMKMVADLISVSDGSIRLFGEKPSEKTRQRMGTLIEAPGLYKKCTAYENMKRFAILSGGNEEEIQEILRLVGLDNVGKKKAGSFSLGMKQRLGIGIALLGNPDFLVLDEPINGLDPAGIKEVRDLLLKINRERQVTILISSHLLGELAKVATKYGIINDGVLVEEISAEELESRCQQTAVIRGNDVNKIGQILMEQFQLTDVQVKEQEVHTAQGMEITAKINQVLVSQGVEVSEIFIKEGSYEDYFIERIGVS